MYIYEYLYVYKFMHNLSYQSCVLPCSVNAKVISYKKENKDIQSLVDLVKSLLVSLTSILHAIYVCKMFIDVTY